MAVTQARISTVATPRKYNTASAGRVVVSTTGGTLTTSGNDSIRTFTSNGTFGVTSSGSSERNPETPSLTSASVIIVGGGAGGGGATGWAQGSGSGGGGGIQERISSTLTITPATLS